MNDLLKEYIEKEIFPMYQKNEEGHQLSHIEYVLRRSFFFARQLSDVNLDMVYTIGSFHDVAHHIDKDHHEILSAQMFYQNERMKAFFTEKERQIIREAIEDVSFFNDRIMGMRERRSSFWFCSFKASFQSCKFSSCSLKPFLPLKSLTGKA